MTNRWLMAAGLLILASSAQAAQGTAAPTWNKDIAPIVYANCITCHRPGEVAPMSLLTYADARPWARGMKAKTSAHEMPPWFADPRYGRFNNKRGLTEAQIATIAAWADAGAPQGAGPAPAVPDLGGRSAELMDRAPDAIIDMPVEMEIDPVRVMPFFSVWAKAPFDENKYIEAIENRPSNRAVTHHSSFFATALPPGAHHIGVGPAFPGGPLINAIPVREDGSQLTDPADNDNEEARANVDTTNSGVNVFTFYAPGTGALKFRAGMVKVIKRDDYVRWNLHYNATGRPEKDRHTVHLWFSKQTAVVEVKSGQANHNNLFEGTELLGSGVTRPNIPAYAENYRVASLQAVSSDTLINSFWPHMHLRGKDMTYSVTYPDGREEILLSVPKYSFEWQLQYQFDDAIKVPAGSILRVVAHYDNSPKNKFNPAPDQELPWGSQSWHEMYFPHFDIAVEKDVIKTQGTN